MQSAITRVAFRAAIVGNDVAAPIWQREAGSPFDVPDYWHLVDRCWKKVLRIEP